MSSPSLSLTQAIVGGTALSQALTMRNAQIMQQVAQQTSNLSAAIRNMNAVIDGMESFNRAVTINSALAATGASAAAAAVALSSSSSSKKKKKEENALQADAELIAAVTEKKTSPLPPGALVSKL